EPSGWRWVGLVLIIAHFFIPFLLLLSRHNKRQAKNLGLIAAGVFVMRFVDAYWLVAPSGPQIDFHWMDVVAPIAIGAWWMVVYFRALARRPLLPVGDPDVAEMISNDAGHEANLA